MGGGPLPVGQMGMGWAGGEAHAEVIGDRFRWDFAGCLLIPRSYDIDWLMKSDSL